MQMDISKTLPLAERVNAIQETWQAMVANPDIHLSDEQIASLSERLDAAIAELWKTFGPPTREHEVGLFSQCAPYMNLPQLPEDIDHPPICDRCKDVTRVREVMPDVFLCGECEAQLDEDLPMDGADFSTARPHQAPSDELPF